MADPRVVIDDIGGNCPVQAEGFIEDQPFYFRARGQRWQIEVGPPGLEWTYGEPWGRREYDAGWMETDTARELIATGARIWAGTRIWTDVQVAKLNEFQASGVMHEFTCGNDHDGDRVLVATPHGWRCRRCAYTQDWAHGFMFQGAPPDPMAMLGFGS